MKYRYIYDKQEKFVPAPIIGEASRNAEFKEASDTLNPEERAFFTGEPQPALSATPTQQVYDPLLYLNQLMRQVDSTLNTSWNPDSYKIVYERETENGFYLYRPDLQAWVYYERKQTVRDQNNLHGGIAHTGKIKDKGIEVCDTIFFLSARKFKREDKPGKHFYDVAYTLEAIGAETPEILHVVIEYNDLSRSDLSDQINASVVSPGKSKICSLFFRSEILRLADNNIEITIPVSPGWYCDEGYGWVYLHRGIYDTFEDHQLPPAMRRRRIDPTEHTVNMEFSEIKKIIDADDSLSILFAISCIAPFQSLLKCQGISVNQIIVPVITATAQAQIVAALFKSNDDLQLQMSSLDKGCSMVEKEVTAARDGCAVIQGPMTAAEAKINGKAARLIRDSATGANGTKDSSRCMITLPCRFVPDAISQDCIFKIDCSGIPVNTDIMQLRSKILGFHSALISYIESNYDKVEGIVRERVNKHRGKRFKNIPFEKDNLYLMQIVAEIVMNKCFNIYLFNKTTFESFTRLFTEEASPELSPNYVVRDKFITVTIEMIMDGFFSFIDISFAHKNYSDDGRTLILDRKKCFLNFTMKALDKIAKRIPTVKDGPELARILKACVTIKCTDNGARQITTPQGRTGFYSVYLSEFGDDILPIIRYIDNIEFFMLPEEVPENFIPLVWFGGRCAGIVLDGIGLPNPHINICGMSGMGKNRGAYRNGECFLRLRSKFIFINIKGPITEDSLNDMGCSTDKYDLFDLKTEGLPFDIFNVSGFKGKNAKVSYILNIICAAVNDLTDNQLNELSDYVNSMVGDDTQSFSLLELFEKFPKNRAIALQKKLTPLFNMMSAYTPKDENYKYSSCREFIDDCGRITVLSIVQSNITALRCTVYALLQSIFEHQILDSHTRLVLYADEMQKYTSDSPFQQWFAEGRQYNIIAAGMTQEYRSRDNETLNFTSSASIEIFYPPATASADKVFKALNKEFSIEELCSGNLGDIIGKGFFWSSVEKRHKSAILCGKNDDDNFSKLKIRPKGYYGNVL